MNINTTPKPVVTSRGKAPPRFLTLKNNTLNIINIMNIMNDHNIYIYIIH